MIAGGEVGGYPRVLLYYNLAEFHADLFGRLVLYNFLFCIIVAIKIETRRERSGHTLETIKEKGAKKAETTSTSKEKIVRLVDRVGIPGMIERSNRTWYTSDEKCRRCNGKQQLRRGGGRRMSSQTWLTTKKRQHIAALTWVTRIMTVSYRESLVVC